MGQVNDAPAANFLGSITILSFWQAGQIISICMTYGVVKSKMTTGGYFLPGVGAGVGIVMGEILEVKASIMVVTPGGSGSCPA